jgi:hypothetical protein
MSVDDGEPVVYCLTRDRDLAAAIEGELVGALAFFYNDAARLQQAILLRLPDVVVVDTGAVRREFGDAGLGPVVHFTRERAPEARVALRPARDADWLASAEAGEGVDLLPANPAACATAVVALIRA